MFIMKKYLAFSALTLILFSFISCASDNDMKHKEADKEEVKSENPVGIQNVNGNIPDTVNTIDISTHKKDSTMNNVKDSVK